MANNAAAPSQRPVSKLGRQRMDGFGSYLPALERAHAATRRVIPNTGCQLASSLLASELWRRGKTADYVQGRYSANPDQHHWWVEVDGLVLDPTRDQFGEDPFVESYAGSYTGEGRKTGSDIENEAYTLLRLSWSYNR
jgi:hypothetical protein